MDNLISRMQMVQIIIVSVITVSQLIPTMASFLLVIVQSFGISPIHT